MHSNKDNSLENDLDDVARLEAEKVGEMREAFYLDALKQVLSTRAGRRFIWGLMGKLGYGRTVYAGRNQATNFNAGRQSGANDLVVEIDLVNEEAFLLMIKESKEENLYVRNSINTSGSGEQSSSGGGVTSGFDSINAINTSGNTGSK